MSNNDVKEKFPFVFKDCIDVDYTENKIDMTLKKNKIKEKSPAKLKKEIASAFMELLKGLSPHYALINFMYNFIVTTELLEEYIVPSVKISRITIDLDNLSLALQDAQLWLIPTLTLRFTKIEDEYKCIAVNLYKSCLDEHGKYVSKEMMILNDIINDNSYILDTSDNNKFTETAYYYVYSSGKAIRNNVKYAVESISKGKSLFDISGPCQTKSVERYFAVCEPEQYKNNEKSYIYKGTYSFKDYAGDYKSALNITRVYQEGPKSLMISIDRLHIYATFDIHSLLYRSINGCENFGLIPLNYRLSSETIEYTEDFYKRFSSVLQELPSSKNYYYTENSVLEISNVEIAGSGKQLKKTNQYYKLLKSTNKEKYLPQTMIYVIRPDLSDITKSIYETAEFSWKVNIIDPETNQDEINEIETIIKEACDTVGIQYR